MSKHYLERLIPEAFYHIYNRGNNKIDLFYTSENYRYFITKFDEYLDGYVEIYAFCLMPNHFHFLIKIKSAKEIQEKFTAENTETKLKDAGLMVSEQFKRFFMSYAKSINKQENRTGSLFEKHFKRKIVDKDEYLKELVVYIHRNPIHHNFVPNLYDYYWTSFRRVLSERNTKLKKKEVLSWFGCLDTYFEYHHKTPKDIEDYCME